MSKNKHLSGDLFMAKPTPLTQTETSISSQIAEYLSDRKLWNERLNCGRIQTAFGNWVHLCEQGTPDRITLINGQAVFIETKSFGKKPTPDQLRKHEELRRNGAIVIVPDSFDYFITQFNAIREQIERRENLYK